MCNDRSFHLKFKGWTLCQSDMTAKCPHGNETEIDGSIATDSGCPCAGMDSPIFEVL